MKRSEDKKTKKGKRSGLRIFLDFVLELILEASIAGTVIGIIALSDSSVITTGTQDWDTILTIISSVTMFVVILIMLLSYISFIKKNTMEAKYRNEVLLGVNHTEVVNANGEIVVEELPNNKQLEQNEKSENKNELKPLSNVPAIPMSAKSTTQSKADYDKKWMSHAKSRKH